MNNWFYSEKHAPIFRYLFIFICFVPLFLFRDATPNNELKYLSIADEAIRDGHIFTFWNHGIAYADKPPLYLWIVMLGKWLFGYHSMLFLGLFSILPALAILYVMNCWVTPMLSSGRRQIGQLMLMTSGLFTAATLVVRMDMLMCMFIVLSLYTFYKLYTGQNTLKNHLLLPLYIFLAIFSKGPVGLLVPLLSIVIFLLVTKRIKEFGKYMGIREFGILIGLCALWFMAVFIEGGKTYLNNLLLDQTINRAVDASYHKELFGYYLKTIWYLLAPWTLFYAIVILIALKKRLIQTDLEKLFLTVIVTTLVMLSIFSSKLDIYLLPIFPFITYLSFLLQPKIKRKYVYFTITLPAVLLTLVFPALVIATPYFEVSFSEYPAILIASCLLSITSALSLVLIFRKQLLRSANMISTGILLTILISGFAIRDFNSYIGFGNLARETEKIGKEKGINDYYFYQFRSGENIDSYLNRKIERVNIDELIPKIKSDNFILLVKNKDLQPGKILYQYINNKEIYSIGDYSIIIFHLN